MSLLANRAPLLSTLSSPASAASATTVWAGGSALTSAGGYTSGRLSNRFATADVVGVASPAAVDGRPVKSLPSAADGRPAEPLSSPSDTVVTRSLPAGALAAWASILCLSGSWVAGGWGGCSAGVGSAACSSCGGAVVVSP